MYNLGDIYVAGLEWDTLYRMSIDQALWQSILKNFTKVGRTNCERFTINMQSLIIRIVNIINLMISYNV